MGDAAGPLAGPLGELLREGGCALRGDPAGPGPGPGAAGGGGGSAAAARQHFAARDVSALRRWVEVALTLDERRRGRVLQALEAQMDEPEALDRLLQPIQDLGPAGGTAAASGDSVARVLLSCRCVQPRVAGLLLERAALLGDSEEELRQMRILLAQFRWMDSVAEETALLAKLLEVFAAAPAPVQREILSFVPELVADDAQAEQAVEALKDKLDLDIAFLKPVLEAFGNIHVPPAAADEIVESVLKQFRAVRVEDLPCLVRYLVQHMTEETGAEVVRTLRKGLHFVERADPRRELPDLRQKGKVGAEDAGRRLLQAFRTAFQCAPAAQGAFLAALKAAKAPADHLVLDFWLLALVHSFGADRRKAAVSLLRRKVTSGQVGLAWPAKALAKAHQDALADFFPSILSIAESLMCASDAPNRAFAAEMYVLLFAGFTGDRQRTDTLGAVLAHVGSAAEGEVTAALGAFAKIASEHTEALAAFGSFVATVLDHISRFTGRQLHVLFAAISDLVVHPYVKASCLEEARQSRLEDELAIVTRKQLSAISLHHRRIGIIATLTHVQNLATASEAAADPVCAKHLADEASAQLTRTIADSKGHAESFAFLCDELTHAVHTKRLASKALLEQIDESMQEDLSETFFLDLEGGRMVGPGGADPGVAGDLWYDLNEAGESPVGVRIFPLVTSSRQAERDALKRLCAQIRLAAMLEHALHGAFDGLNAVMGCPLIMFPEEWLHGDNFRELPPHRQESCCKCLFYAISWCTELTSAFTLPCGKPLEVLGADFQQILVQRVNNLMQLEAKLELCLRFGPALELPKLRDLVDPPAHGTQTQRAGPKRVLKERAVNFQAQKKKKLAHASTGSKAAGGSQKAAETPLVDLLQQRGNFRPMHLAAAHLLGADGVGVRSSTTGLPAINYLMQNLLERMKDAAPATAAGSDAGELKQVLDLVPAVERHLLESTALVSEGDAADLEHGVCGGAVANVKLALDCFNALLAHLAKCPDGPALFGGLVAKLGRAETEPGRQVKGVQELLRHLARETRESFDIQYKVFQFMVALHGGTERLLEEDLSGMGGEEIYGFAKRILDGSWTAGGEANVWKGRAKELQTLVQELLRKADDPHAEILAHARVLKHVHAGDKPNEAVDGHPSVSAGTLKTWYGCLPKGGQRLFETDLEELRKAQKVADTAGETAAVRRMMENSLEGLVHFAETFKYLVTNVKTHAQRPVAGDHPKKADPLNLALQKAVLTYTPKAIGKLLKYQDTFKRQKNDEGRWEKLREVIKLLQKAFRIVQIFCDMGKSNNAAQLQPKIPQTKRAIEKFVWQAQALYEDEHVEVGNLKAKDLEGNVLPSQLYPDAPFEDGADEDEEDDGVDLGSDDDDDDEPSGGSALTE